MVFGAFKLCPETESNRRHEDFQSSALPTELSGRMNDFEGLRNIWNCITYSIYLFLAE